MWPPDAGARLVGGGDALAAHTSYSAARRSAVLAATTGRHL